MLAREADAMFWIGRYVERAEATARIVDVQYHSELEGAFPLTRVVPSEEDAGKENSTGENPAGSLSALWGPILAISGDADLFASLYDDNQVERNVLDFFAFCRENGNSIKSCVVRARENARGVREMLSSEMYECLNIFFLEVTRWDVDKVLESSPHGFFTQVKNTSHLFHGITDRTLPIDEARAFLECGMFLERADKTARILDVKYHILLDSDELGGTLDQHQWIAVLKSVGAFEAFRKTHRFGITPAKVVSFLVRNPAFPASISYAVTRVDRALRLLSGSRGLPATNRAERLVGRLRADLSYITTDEIIEMGLHQFLDQVEIRCIEIGNAISEAYLKY